MLLDRSDVWYKYMFRAMPINTVHDVIFLISVRDWRKYLSTIDGSVVIYFQ